MFDIPYIKLHFYTELMADTVMPETKVAALRGGGECARESPQAELYCR